MAYRFWRVVPLVITGLAVAACGTAPAATMPGSASGGVCTSPLANKSGYMQSASIDYRDSKGPLAISFSAHNRFESLPGDKESAYFDVPGGSYSFPPDVTQTSPGVFSLAFSGSGQFTGSNFGRAATVDLKGTVDENTGAVDLTLKAEGSVFHLAIAATDTTGAVALSKRIAADIESKNWSDVHDAYSPTLKSAGDSKAYIAGYMNAQYGHVSSACRIGPGQYAPNLAPFAFPPLFGDRFYDVLAITVTVHSGGPVATFARIDLTRENGVWVFVAGNMPGVGGDGTASQQSGIPVPSP
jgi:hypothetical protein